MCLVSSLLHIQYMCWCVVLYCHYYVESLRNYVGQNNPKLVLLQHNYDRLNMVGVGYALLDGWGENT